MGMDLMFSVLFFDDEEEFLKTIINCLRKHKANISGSKSGAETLHMLKQHPVDVVVLDAKMLSMNGVQTLRENNKSFPLTEVVMLTTYLR